jgi:two-component system, cell cycle sensor histidine kinase and response regulator CckA
LKEAATFHLIHGMGRGHHSYYSLLRTSQAKLVIASLHKGDIRLPLTDVIMPKLRGPELASRLRLKFPGPNVIYRMSGHTESTLVQDGMLGRNTVLLQKPFTVKRILEVIHQMNASVGG